MAGKTSIAPIEAIGRQVATIPVELSTRFLEHFSEQLYSSPQKAFEELISNGWDASADVVDVRISDDLRAPGATMALIDNGSSMDETGLRALWHIAFSPKRDRPKQNGRFVIGKFGIGKLATYVLASKLTYICKAADGIIRRVTMDYTVVEASSIANADRLISELHLNIYQVTQDEVKTALSDVAGGLEILSLIETNFNISKKSGIKQTVEYDTDNEFGGARDALVRPHNSTWTLVILSDLKPAGQKLKIGILRRMLQASLPIESEMLILINGEKLASTKLNATPLKKWQIGPDLGIDSLDVDQEGDDNDADINSSAATQAKSVQIAIQSGQDPYPFVEIPGIGRITGTATLFEDKISGGKSDDRGASNGFYINVLGRVVNQSDPSFGQMNLSHAAWARFRMTVRADGLNELLTTNREQFKESYHLKLFKNFLRRVFNKARTIYDSDATAELPDGGDALVQSLGVLSLSPLRNVVSETLRTKATIPGLFDEDGITDREEKRREWRANTANNIRSTVGRVRYEKANDDSFVKFRIGDSTVVVNKDHPFVMEHSRTKAEKELVRTVAMVSLLADVYALDIGIDPAMLRDIREYRDKLMRFRALQRRQSGTHIARLLLHTQHQSDKSKRFEAVVSDALRYLGFEVLDLAQPGQPEGIASAYPAPTRSEPTQENPNPPLYSFSFDAKSAGDKVAKTSNICLDGVAEHRDRYRADHALVIAPGFSDGALARRCQQLRITPICAQDLGRLLEYTVEFGAIPVTTLRDMLFIYDPKEVANWVAQLGRNLKSGRRLTLDLFLKALELLKGKVPDYLSASTIALTCRESLKVASIRAEDVAALVRGLQIIIPDLVGITEDKIVVNASPERIASAVATQLEQLHTEIEDGDSVTL